MKKLIFIVFLSPFSLYAWQPQCSFVVQASSSSKIQLENGSVGNLCLISCSAVTSQLPNYNWLTEMCARYKTPNYPTIILEGDDSKAECTSLANQKIIVYSAGSQYWTSNHNTPSTLSGDKPVVMKFPSEFSSS